MDASYRQIRESLYQLETVRKAVLRPYFTQLGLTIGQGQPRILSYLLERDGITQKELAEGVSLDTTTLSRVLDHMEKAELLYRQQRPESRRSFAIHLTENGQKKAKAVRKGFQVLQEQLCQGLTAQEIATLLSCLDKMMENLKSFDIQSFLQEDTENS